MELVFSKHAVEQMLKRHISPEEAERLVDHPDGEFAQSKDKKVYYKRFPKRKDNLLAAVVIQQSAKVLEIITVMHHFEVRI